MAKSSIPAVTLQFIGELIFERNHINVMYVARPLVKLQTLQFIGVFILERKHMDVLSGKAFSHIGKLAVYPKFILERNCINVLCVADALLDVHNLEFIREFILERKHIM